MVMSRFADVSLDPVVIDTARRGDPGAQEQIYRAFAGAVYTLALRLTQRQALAEEILQDSLFTVLTRLDSYRGDAPLGFWVREITVNRCLMELRSGWHRRISLLGESMEAWGMDSEPAPEISAPECVDLERALARLPETGRAVVWLHDVEGYTHQEIARLMGKTASFSKSQLARAHRKLRELLSEKSLREPQCMQVTNNY